VIELVSFYDIPICIKCIHSRYHDDDKKYKCYRNIKPIIDIDLVTGNKIYGPDGQILDCIEERNSIADTNTCKRQGVFYFRRWVIK
jgi:hypothetical protein